MESQSAAPEIKNHMDWKKLSESTVVQKWPEVKWPSDSVQPGLIYSYSELNKTLTPTGVTFTTYLDVSGDRQKIHTKSTLADGTETETIDFMDYKNHKNYVHDVKKDTHTAKDWDPTFSLTEYVTKVKDSSSGVCRYLGVKYLPWVPADQASFHAFHILSKHFSQTAFFDTKSGELLWQTPDNVQGSESYTVISHPSGITDQQFTDADFEGLAHGEEIKQ